MRISRAVAALTAAVLITAVGCTNQVAGTAKQDPAQPPLALSEDGSGIVAGYPDAPVQIEIYTEPQCNHCAELQAEFGDEIGRYINLGQLAVTYRSLTFLDEPGTARTIRRGWPTRCSSPSGRRRQPRSPMWRPDPSSNDSSKSYGPTRIPGGQGPTDEEMEEMATKAGMPYRCGARDRRAVRTRRMSTSRRWPTINFGSLIGLDPINSGTPTVYDLDNEEKVDIYDNDWLDKLMSSA